MFTCLTGAGQELEETEIGLSSIVDTWLLLRDSELGGERNRTLYILKSRGTAHSNQLREYLITSQGIEILDAYLGSEGVLTGSARLAQEARERAAKLAREQGIEKQRLVLERRRRALDAEIARLRFEFEAEQSAAEHAIAQDLEREQVLVTEREAMSRSRRADREARERRRRPDARGDGKGART
jgi:circadian clock protein KaiC